MTRKSLQLVTLLVLAASLCSCVSRGFPTHGGGKRFSREQQLLSRAIDEAVDKISFENLDNEVRQSLGNGVGLRIQSMAHSGGGGRSTSGGLGFFGSLFGFGGTNVGNNGAAIGSGGVAASSIQTDYQSFGFRSAEDLDYLNSRVLMKLGQEEIPFNAADQRASLETGVVVVSVGVLGTDESSLNALIVSSNRLKAYVHLDAVLLQQREGQPLKAYPLVQGLEQGEGVTVEGKYSEWYIFGIGPVNDAEPDWDVVDREF